MRAVKTLKELQTQTKAYDSFAVIADCSIPDYYKETFPHHCACGAEMIMTEPGHTQLQCCNPACWVKMGHKLSYFISSLGYKGFGEQSGLAIMRSCHDKLKFPSFLAAFLLSDTELSSGLTEYYVGLFNEIKLDIYNNSFLFADAIAALGIQNLGSRSTFFDVVKSPLVLLDYAIKNKTDELCEIAGIQAPISRFQLQNSILDIVTLMKDIMPNIMDTPKGEIYVAITGSVTVNNKSYTRKAFIDLCEAIRGNYGEQLYKLVETKAAAKVEFVIADAPSNSDKYRLGERLGKLITATEFYQVLLDRAKQNDNLEKEGENSNE